jgi:hypothetical protein
VVVAVAASLVGCGRVGLDAGAGDEGSGSAGAGGAASQGSGSGGSGGAASDGSAAPGGGDAASCVCPAGSYFVEVIGDGAPMRLTHVGPPVQDDLCVSPGDAPYGVAGVEGCGPPTFDVSACSGPGNTPPCLATSNSKGLYVSRNGGDWAVTVHAVQAMPSAMAGPNSSGPPGAVTGTYTLDLVDPFGRTMSIHGSFTICGYFVAYVPIPC